jgi:hypothetical protein
MPLVEGKNIGQQRRSLYPLKDKAACRISVEGRLLILSFIDGARDPLAIISDLQTTSHRTE